MSALAVLHSVLGDLMLAQMKGVATETTVPELSAAIDKVAELIEAADIARIALGELEESLERSRGYGYSISQLVDRGEAEEHALLSSALARAKGGAL